MKKGFGGLTLSLVLTLAVGVGTGQVFAQAPVCDFWGMSTTFHGRPITTADTIKAYDPDGVLCGVQYAWGGPGQYGIHVEGDLPFTPDKDEGAVDGDTITFYINGEKATVVSGSPVWSPGGYFQLELSVPGPDIAVSTDSVDFGGVQVGSSKDTVLTVSNEGTSPLTINDIVSSNPSVFEVIYTPGFPAIVDVAANIDVTVSFRPADVTTYTDSLTVISDDPDEGTLYVSLTGKGMPAPLVVTTASLADGVVGESYNQTLGASGGVKPYTWGMASGSLPEGLNLDSSGRISGVPSTHGTFSFRVEVTDSLGTKATKDLSITVAPAPLVVTTASLADGVVGESYNQTLGASGGVKPYTWGMASGSLPGGLSLDSSGRISGVPSTHGTFSFRVEVTDSLGTKATKDLSITVAPAPLVVTTASLADGVVGESYNQTLGASGGVKPYTWGMASGNLPGGLSLDSSGRISGVPSTHGTFSFRVEVTDSQGAKATKSLSITVAPAPLVVTTASLADGVVGESYNQTLGASGGVKPYTWGMASGNLPGGLSLDSSGRISGVPSAHGSFSFTVQVTDSQGAKATKDLSITIRGPEINITPERVDFVEVPVGMYRDTTLTISNNGSGILTVDSIVPGDTVVFKVEYASGFPVALDPKDTIEVIIRFCPDSSSAYVDSLKIASNDPDDPLLCVLLTGRGTGLPEIAISSESVDFGVVPVGTFRDSVLKVCNKGTADLRIDDMVLGSSEAFSWIYEPGFPDVLAPGDTIEVTLRFGPEAATVHSDTLRIYSNDPDDPVVSASLEGRGTEVYIALPDTTASPGDTLDVPVLVSDLTGLGITGVGLRITYDAEKLTALGASTGGTIAEGWGTPTYNITDGRMNIGMAGATSLAGSGPLVYIKFAVASDLSLGVTSPLDLAEVELNDGEIPASVQGGSVVVVVTKFDISGKIGYYADTTKAIEGVSVTAFEGGVPVCSDTTDEDGRYELPDLPVGDYTVRPVKEARGRESAVSPLDAAKVLQYYVGLVDLSPYQRIAGDVTGNRQVGPFDAAKILQYYVGLIDSFPAGSWKFVPTSFTLNGTSWSSAPDNLVYEPLDSDKSDQDYVGVLYGDVTGNWSGSTSPKVAVGGVRHVSLSSVSEGVGVFTLLVEVDDATGVLSVGITLSYDPEELRVEEVGPGDLTSDYSIAYKVSDGKLKIGLAGSRELSGSGSLVKVRFRVLKDLGIPVTISEVQLNEGEIPVMIMPTMVEDLAPPEEFALSQNYPNPFNSETNISYQLPAESDVRLEIYNLAGQLVRTLVSDRQEAGSYTVRWDGRDGSGKEVAGGIYFYRIRAGKFSQIKKMVLLR